MEGIMKRFAALLTGVLSFFIIQSALAQAIFTDNFEAFSPSNWEILNYGGLTRRRVVVNCR